MAVDLGSGGGLPGLVLALVLPAVHWTLVDAAEERADHLRRSVTSLGLSTTDVVHARAEVLGRGSSRMSFDAVVARSLARPWITARCVSGLLRQGGTAVIAASSSDIWPEEPLGAMGLRVVTRPDGFVVLESDGTAPMVPRRLPDRW
jgi:16S rRNA (guanine527-N7)-methyltransferase